MLKEFSNKFLKHEATINDWLQKHMEQIEGPIYASVDIRNAGYKIAPVDTNIFPGGFNNLCVEYQHKAGILMKQYIEKFHPNTKKILLIPENHTRNKYYFSNVSKIKKMLEEQGFEICVGSLNPEIPQDKSSTFQTAEEEELVLSPIRREDNLLLALDFDADIYLLNNDVSDGIPEILTGLDRPILPNPEIGWHSRSKNNHFSIYNSLIEEFAQIVELDPWFFNTQFDNMVDVDFSSKKNMEELATKTDNLIKKIEQKHQEYNIDGKSYVFIKNDSGTYGMGVTNVYSGEEVLSSSRKSRNKMSTGKGNKKISKVIIQEGIQTIDRFHDLVAEPVIYLANNQVAGGFFRLNEVKDAYSNLNSKGMKFTKICFHKIKGYSNVYNFECNLECLEKIYNTIAQIASIAAGYELKALNK